MIHFWFFKTIFSISQAFHRVWYDVLLFKLKHFLPSPFYLIIIIIKSYLENQSFSVRQKNNYSTVQYIKAGVLQFSDLSPILYNIFTTDLLTSNQTLLASIADDTTILKSNKFSDIASQNLQLHLNKIESWAKKWKIKINDEKSTQVNFSLNKRECPSLKFKNKPIPLHQSTKYLGIILNKRLTWSNHTKQKQK